MSKLISQIYPIERWDVALFKNSITKVPIIYIKPDDLFITFADKNNYIVNATITNTNTIYDGKTLIGVVDKSSRIPNDKPNFFKKYGWYVISLWADWHGYPHPSTLGNVTFSGLNAVTEDDIKKVSELLDDSVPKTMTPRKLSNMATTNTSNKKHSFIISIIIISIILLLLFVYIYK